MMKQAQQMQANMEKAQEQLALLKWRVSQARCGQR